MKRPYIVLNSYNNVDAKYVDCTLQVSSGTSLPPSQPILLSSLNPTSWSKWKTIPEQIVLDRVAILSTRGYANIYHNSEWIMNFVHYADVEDLVPLVI